MLAEGNIVKTYIGWVVRVPVQGSVTHKAKKHVVYVCVCWGGGDNEEDCNSLWIVFY